MTAALLGAVMVLLCLPLAIVCGTTYAVMTWMDNLRRHRSSLHWMRRMEHELYREVGVD